VLQLQALLRTNWHSQVRNLSLRKRVSHHYQLNPSRREKLSLKKPAPSVRKNTRVSATMSAWKASARKSAA
jgi:hypothetical protein